METLEATKEQNEIIACLSLLSMGIKSVPQAVLRKKFSDCGPVFLSLLEAFVDTENQNVLRSVSIFPNFFTFYCSIVLTQYLEYSFLS